MRGPNADTPIAVSGKFFWRDQFLDADAMYKADIGSEAWYLWLDGNGHTTFYHNNIVCDFTARRERRRDQFVWYAFKTANERTYKAYIGPSHLVDQERLAKAADKLYEKI